jgi:hypothetical protein
MKDIPTGRQTFKASIEAGYVYAGKTGFLPPLIKKFAVFLSRPRRSGNSLLPSTLKFLFEGGAELFKGLKIMDQGFQFKISRNLPEHGHGQQFTGKIIRRSAVQASADRRKILD